MAKEVYFFQKIYMKLPVITFDVLAIPLAWLLANAVQFDSLQLFQTWVLGKSWVPLLVLLVLQVPCYYGFKVYRGLWQFSSRFKRLEGVMRCARALKAHHL